MDVKTCPCGSSKKYGDCCEPIIKNLKAGLTAESVMRARYSAYVTHEIEFIAESCVKNENANDIDLDETRKWSEESQWHGLKIHETKDGGVSDSEGIVEFSAFYSRKGLRDEHREVAGFKKIDDKWYYAEGQLVPTTIVRSTPKVGRNDPCPCGSGKKYKQCCGK